MPYRGEVTPRSPNGTRIPPRSIRVPDDTWNAAKEEADRRGETVTAAILRFLEKYAKGR